MAFNFDTFGEDVGSKPTSSSASPSSGGFNFDSFGSSVDSNTDRIKRGYQAYNNSVGFTQGLAQSIARPFLQTGSSIANVGTNLIATGAAAVGAKGIEDKFSTAARNINNNGVDYGYFGNAKPLGSGFDVTKSLAENIQPLKEAAGAGLEMGSYLVGGSGAGSAIGSGVKGLVAKRALGGAVQGLGAGVLAGGLQGAGSALQDNASAWDTLKSTVLGGTAGGVLGAAGGAVLGAASPLVSKAAAEAVGKIKTQNAANKVESLIGNVLQGKASDINKARDVLTSIDTKSVKTYGDLSKAIQTKVDQTLAALDDKLGQDTRVFKGQDLSLKMKSGGESISHNYVNDSIKQLEEFYTKTNDPVKLAGIKQIEARAAESGLTVKDINDLARIHGQEFVNGKAFNKDGDAVTSVTAQAAENTRTGLKQTARSLFGNPIYTEADRQAANMLRTKTLVDRVDAGVTKLEQKIQERGIMENVGRMVGQVANKISGGSLKGLVESFIPRGQGFKTLNALDLEKMLQKNLIKIQDLVDKEYPTNTFIEKIQDLIKTIPNKQGGFIRIPGVKAENIHPDDAKLLQKYIDAVRTPKSTKLTENQYSMVEKLAQKFNISLDNSLSSIANQFDDVLSGGKRVKGTLIPGSLRKAK